MQQVINKMKYDVQLWHDLLWHSWGKLELSKCKYHVIHYDFDANGRETIMLNNEHREEIPINAKLGYYKYPNGTCVTNSGHVKKVAVERVDAIVKCGGTRAETRMFVQSVWKLAIEYNSPQSFLSGKLLKSIRTASMPKLYVACGCNCNTSRVSSSRTSRAIGR